MAYQENQTIRFSRSYKRLNKRQLLALHPVMDRLKANPKLGTEKTGDLSNFFVFKFKDGKDELLIGYTFNTAKKTITWHAVAHHENFYRDIKKS